MPLRPIFLFTPVLILAASAMSQTMDREQIAKYVQHLMDIEVGFMNAVPPGTSIDAREISRMGSSNKDLVVQYHIFVKGVPSGVIFRYLNWPVNADQPSVAMEGVTAGRDGILMCAERTPDECGDADKPDDPIEFITKPRRGEPYRVAFISPDLKIGTVLVPDPIEAADKGCTLSAVRLTAKFELAFITGKGYPPNTDIHYRVIPKS
jgi:hypothetical protein